MKLFTVWLLLWVGIISNGFTQTPSYFEVNTANSSVPALEVYQANAVTFSVRYKNGTNNYNLSGQTPFMFWAPSQVVPPIITAQWSVVSSVSGLVSFSFSPSSVNYSNGISGAIYGVGLANVPQTLRQGSFSIVADPYVSGVAGIPYTTNVMWGSINWVGLPTFLTNGTLLARSGTGSTEIVDGELKINLGVESDPLFVAASNSFLTEVEAEAKYATGTPLYVQSSSGVDTTARTAADWASNRADSAHSLASDAATGTPLYVESDPVFTSSVSFKITSAETGRWSTAYSWGDHGVAGYLTGYTETDPLWAAASNNYYTKAAVDVQFASTGDLETARGELEDLIDTGSSNHYTKAQSDARFASTGALATIHSELEDLIDTGSTNTYTKAQSDSRFASTGDLETARSELEDLIDTGSSNHYTKAQSDTRYQGKGTGLAVTNQGPPYMVLEWDTGGGYIRQEAGAVTTIRADGILQLSAGLGVRLDPGTEAIFSNLTLYADGRGVTNVPASGIVDVPSAWTDSYSQVQSDTRFTDTNTTALLRLNYNGSSQRLDTVLGWGNWATNGLATTNWVLTTINALTNRYVSFSKLNDDESITLWELTDEGVKAIAHLPLGGDAEDPNYRAIYLDEGHFRGDWMFDKQVAALGFIAYDNDSQAYYSLTATGGLRVGVNSFQADLAGNISQDSTNSATFGRVSVESLTNSAGAIVMWSTNTPTFTQYAALLARVVYLESTLTQQVASLMAQLPIVSNAFVAADAVITAQVAGVDTRLVLASNYLGGAKTSQDATNVWLYVQITNGDHVVSAGLSATVAANLATFSTFTNTYAGAITNVDAVTFGGTIKSGFMLTADFEAVSSNIVFGFAGTVAATNSAGAQNWMKYDGTNQWFRDQFIWRTWSKNVL